jgi:hypothetical protein
LNENDLKLFDELLEIDKTKEKSQQLSRWQKIVTWIKNHPVITSLAAVTTGVAAALITYKLYTKLTGKQKTNSPPDTVTDPQPQTHAHTSWQVYDLNTKTASKQDKVFVWDDSLKKEYELTTYELTTNEEKMTVIVDKGVPYIIEYQKAQNKKDPSKTINVATKETWLPINTWEDGDAFIQDDKNNFYYYPCDNDNKIQVFAVRVGAGTLSGFLKYDKDDPNKKNDPEYYLLGLCEALSLDLTTIKNGYTKDMKGNIYHFYVAEAKDKNLNLEIEVALTSPVFECKADDDSEESKDEDEWLEVSEEKSEEKSEKEVVLNGKKTKLYYKYETKYHCIKYANGLELPVVQIKINDGDVPVLPYYNELATNPICYEDYKKCCFFEEPSGYTILENNKKELLQMPNFDGNKYYYYQIPAVKAYQNNNPHDYVWVAAGEPVMAEDLEKKPTWNEHSSEELEEEEEELVSSDEEESTSESYTSESSEEDSEEEDLVDLEEELYEEESEEESEEDSEEVVYVDLDGQKIKLDYNEKEEYYYIKLPNNNNLELPIDKVKIDEHHAYALAYENENKGIICWSNYKKCCFFKEPHGYTISKENEKESLKMPNSKKSPWYYKIPAVKAYRNNGDPDDYVWVVAGNPYPIKSDKDDDEDSEESTSSSSITSSSTSSSSTTSSEESTTSEESAASLSEEILPEEELEELKEDSEEDSLSELEELDEKELEALVKDSLEKMLKNIKTSESEKSSEEFDILESF